MLGIYMTISPENRPGTEGEPTEAETSSHPGPWRGSRLSWQFFYTCDHASQSWPFLVEGLESSQSPNFSVGATIACTHQAQAPPMARNQEDKLGLGLWARPLHELGKKGLEKLWNSTPTDRNRRPCAPNACRPHTGPISFSASLLAKVSHVVKNQFHIAGLHVPVADPNALTPHSHQPGLPPPGAPAGVASRLPSQQPMRLGVAARGSPCCPSHALSTSAGRLPTLPCCSHIPKIQGSFSTSSKFQERRAPGLASGLQEHPIFSRPRPCFLNFHA